jgi:hypothetical protein
MSKHFRTRSSHRRARRPTASWIVAGPKGAKAIARGDITMIARPAKSGDHQKRYQPGMRLAVKMCVGIKGMSDTLCHVRVLDARGPRELMTAGQIGFAEARMLGHDTTGTFKLNWVREHDEQWWRPIQERLNGRDPDEDTLDEFLDRFDSRWASKLIWAVRFEIDITEASRLLAVRSDELYVESPARALPDEFPAISEADYKRHVQGRRDMSTADWIAKGEEARAKERETKSVEERLQRLERDARQRGIDISDDMWRIRKRLPFVTAQSLEKQIMACETRVYRFAA